MMRPRIRLMTWCLLACGLLAWHRVPPVGAAQNRPAKQNTQPGSTATTAPSEILSVVTLQNPTQFLQNLGQFLAKVQPGLEQQLNSGILGQALFFNPGWEGMDMAGEYTLLVLATQSSTPPPMVLVIPLTDRAKYLKALGGSLKKSGDTGGLHTFQQANTQKKIFVAFAGNRGVVAESETFVAQVKSRLESRDPALDKAPFVQTPLSVAVPVRKVAAFYRPMIQDMRAALQAQVESQMPTSPQETAPPGTPSAEQTAAMLKLLQAEMDWFLALLEQTETVSLGLDPQVQGLRMTQVLDPVPGSMLARFVTTQVPTRLTPLLGVFPADAALQGSGAVKITPEVVAFYTTLMQLLNGLSGQNDAAALARTTQWVQDYIKVFSGEVLFSGLSPTNDALITYLYKVQDIAQAKALMQSYPDILKTMMGFYQSLGMTLDLQALEPQLYKGAEILLYRMRLTQAQLGDQRAQEIYAKLFGNEITFPMGFQGDSMVSSFGKDALGQVQQVLDRLQEGTTRAPAHTPTMFGLPEENNMFLYLSMPRLLAWASTLVPEIPKLELPASPGLGMSAQFRDARLEGALFVPVEEIMAIRDTILQLQRAQASQKRP